MYEKSYSAAAADEIELHSVIRRMGTCEWNKASSYNSGVHHHMFHVLCVRAIIHLMSASTFPGRCYYQRHYTQRTTCLIMVHLSEWSARHQV